jgi:hypothetical protein
MVPITILAGNCGLTVIVITLDVAGLPVAQVALEVSTQYTWSLFERDELVYVGLFVPTLAPLSFH